MFWNGLVILVKTILLYFSINWRTGLPVYQNSILGFLPIARKEKLVSLHITRRYLRKVLENYRESSGSLDHATVSRISIKNHRKSVVFGDSDETVALESADYRNSHRASPIPV